MPAKAESNSAPQDTSAGRQSPSSSCRTHTAAVADRPSCPRPGSADFLRPANSVCAITSITGSASCTPGVARTVSRVSSGNPVSPAVTSSVDLPASASTVSVNESSSAAVRSPDREEYRHAQRDPQRRHRNSQTMGPPLPRRNLKQRRNHPLSLHRHCRQATSSQNLAVVQRDDSIAEVRRHYVVRHHQQRALVLLLHFIQQPQNLVARR